MASSVLVIMALGAVANLTRTRACISAKWPLSVHGFPATVFCCFSRCAIARPRATRSSVIG